MAKIVIPGIDRLKDWAGKEVAVTEWMTVTQEHIDEFADATGDDQWIHVDRERAARESPYRTTVAHGFLTLSLLPHFFGEAVERSEEHTSELQSLRHLVCRLLLEKKKKNKKTLEL